MSFSWIGKQVATFKQLQLMSYLDSFDTNFERLLSCFNLTFQLPISPTSDPAHYVLDLLALL